MKQVPVYEEEVTSRRTGLLFAVLTLLSFLLFIWLVTVAGVGPLFIVFSFCLFCILLFSWLNYRTLIIRIWPASVDLKFGIFRWSIPMSTIAECYLENTSLWRIAGAGIHFTFIKRRYRVMFNFLEHQRVVLLLGRKKGLVREIAFSTRQPVKIRRIISGRIKPA